MKLKQRKVKSFLQSLTKEGVDPRSHSSEAGSMPCFLSKPQMLLSLLVVVVKVTVIISSLSYRCSGNQERRTNHNKVSPGWLERNE